MTHDDPASLVTRLSTMPLSTEDMRSTWNPPEWEQIVEWWDECVSDARKLTGLSYRNPNPTE